MSKSSIFPDCKKLKWLPANTGEYDKSRERSIRSLGLSPVSLQFDPWGDEQLQVQEHFVTHHEYFKSIVPLRNFNSEFESHKYLKSNLCKVSKKFGIFLVKSCEIKVVFWTKPSQWSQCVFTKFFKLFLSASSSYSRFYTFIFLLFLFLFRDLVKLDFENY